MYFQIPEGSIQVLQEKRIAIKEKKRDPPKKIPHWRDDYFSLAT